MARRRTTTRQVVVVTGASSGIGRAVARAFAERGADVVLAARGEQALREVATECERRGARTLVHPTDVGDAAQVDALADAAVARFGRVDAWVGAAAVWSYGRFEDTPADVVEQVLRTTLLGQVHGARAALRVFRRQGSGVLVTVGSLYGRLSSPYVSAYVAAKWGLAGLTDVLRQELRDAPGIHVTTVIPGTVDTPIYRHAAVYTGREIRPLPPVVPPERVARAVVRVVDRPRRQVVVGRTLGSAVWLHHLVPGAYDHVVGPVVDLLSLRRRAAPPRVGTVFDPEPHAGPVSDGWRRGDHRRVAALVLPLAAVAAGLAAVSRRAGDRLRLRA